jgi:hypothetical protein
MFAHTGRRNNIINKIAPLADVNYRRWLRYRGGHSW